MALSDNDLALIMRHIEGDLDTEEQKQYATLFESSEEFRQEVLEAEAIVAGINALERQKEVEEINDVFKGFDASVKEDRSSNTIDESDGKKTNSYWQLGIAASVSIILIVSYIAFFQSPDITTDQIYADSFAPFPFSDARNNGDVSVGLTLYKAGKYEQSIAALRQESNNADEKMTRIYLANALLITNQVAGAIEVLEQTDAGQAEQFLVQYRSWYLGLAYLKNQQLIKATEQFSKLTYPGSLYEKEAKEVLEMMETMK